MRAGCARCAMRCAADAAGRFHALCGRCCRRGGLVAGTRVVCMRGHASWHACVHGMVASCSHKLANQSCLMEVASSSSISLQTKSSIDMYNNDVGKESAQNL